MSLQLSHAENLAEVESFKGVDWLREVTTVPADLPNVDYVD
jgi:hypothetical protein